MFGSFELNETAEDITLSLPAVGHDKDDINVEAVGKILTIRSRPTVKTGRVVRPINEIFTMGNAIDSEKITASCKNCIIYVKMMKKEQGKPRKIHVE